MVYISTFLIIKCFRWRNSGSLVPLGKAALPNLLTITSFFLFNFLFKVNNHFARTTVFYNSRGIIDVHTPRAHGISDFLNLYFQKEKVIIRTAMQIPYYFMSHTV